MEPSESNQPVRIGGIGAGGRMRGVLGRVLKSAPSHRLHVEAVYDPDEIHAPLFAVWWDMT